MSDVIKIATRESPLALWQAEHVQALLRERYPEKKVELLGMTTQGDQILDKTLSKIGGKGLFVTIAQKQPYQHCLPFGKPGAGTAVSAKLYGICSCQFIFFYHSLIFTHRSCIRPLSVLHPPRSVHSENSGYTA